MANYSKLNHINVGSHGTFKKSGNLHTKPSDIDAIFQHLTDSQASKLVVHFHGGLVNEGKGEAISRSMHTLYHDVAHPVTFIWEAGFIETVSRNLSSLADTKLFQKVVKYVIRRAASKLGGGIGDKGSGEEMSIREIEAELARTQAFDRFDAGARGAAGVLDEAELDAIESEIQAEVELDLADDAEIDSILETEPPITDLLTSEFKAGSGQQQKGLISTGTLAIHITKIVYRVIKRFIRKRDHGFYPTIVEETLRQLYLADLGKWVWSGMKEIADSMWDENTLPLGDDDHPGRYFLEKLTAHQQANPDFIIDLVGHSAGSIAICHMQRTARASFPGLKIRNISFLAPACTQNLFRKEIVAHPDEYEHFRMFTMQNDLETRDELVPKVYTRSLLYFISGVLEDEVDKVIAGLELQLRGEKPYNDATHMEVHQFVNAAGLNQLVLSQTTDAPPGLNSESTSHGGFDDDPTTRQSLKALLID
ncbi:MAG: hypothetical protein ABW168_15775 [Sedimenticola sp.]